jgi:hypothetical protein
VITVGFKDGVELKTARPEVLEAIQVCAELSLDYTDTTMVVTSIADGHHGANSLHRFGLAFDVRTYYWGRQTQEEMAKRFQDALGNDFDVVLESDHIHVEYDP